MTAAIENQLDDLFREVILDHYRKPRNRGALSEATHRLEGMNPVCGDEIYLDVRLANGRIADLAFRGQGCSISQASASMLTQQIKGRTIEEAREVATAVRQMLVDGREPEADIGDLEALAGVAKFPARVKCALLCWNVIRQAIDNDRSAEGGPSHE
jgi:nitrogen fixation NifU-like protein